MRLLLTRPQPDAQRTADALRARGHDVIVAPLMHIETLADADIAGVAWAAILVTSANAASAVATYECVVQLRGAPVFAVGERSAEAMRQVGFAAVTSADGDVADLISLVAVRVQPGARLLYLAGADRSGDLAGDLRARGFDVRTAIIYRAIVASALPAEAATALAEGVGGVLHFSSRSAQAYMDAARRAGVGDAAIKQPVHFCLSAQIAEALGRAGAPDIRVAQRPTESAFIELIGAG